MAGDHKCPVCNSTFTRPQHVARHMRSHTGDRPYKCQHCGDQFARSDLLSRHVNKCHASEKPPTTTAPNRRKGPTAASRATTSKQACDQCVQSSLPCDGCNPCSKCVSRKCRCTYIKFHRQTAPQGPGHPPPSQLLQHNSHSTLAASSFPPPHPALAPLSSTHFNHLQYLSYSQQQYPPIQGHSRTSSTSSAGGTSTRIPGIPDEFLLNAPHHAPGTTSLAAMSLPAPAQYPSATGIMDYPGYPGYGPGTQRESPTPSLTASASTASTSSIDASDMMARYRAQVDLYNRTGLATTNLPVSSSMDLQNMTMLQQGMYDSQQQPHGAAAAGGSQREAWGGQSFHDTSAKHNSTTGAVGTAGSGARGIPFPSVQTHPTAHSADPGGSDGGGIRASSGRHDRGEGGFSSAFGLMSLDDPAVLAGLANDGEPFFTSNRHRDHSEDSPKEFMVDQVQRRSDASPNASDAESSVTSESHGSSNTSLSSFGSFNFDSSSGTTPLATKEEMKEFWRQYMRTPLTGPASGGLFGSLATPLASGGHLQLGHGHEASESAPQRPGFGTSSRRHSRVSSLPSMKTPGVSSEWNMFAHGVGPAQQGSGTPVNAALGFSSIPPPPPFHLTLDPHRRNRDSSLSSTTTVQDSSHSGHRNHIHHHRHGHTLAQQNASHRAASSHNHGEDDLHSYEQAVLARQAPTQLSIMPRRRGTIHLGAVGKSLESQSYSQNSARQQAKQAQASVDAHQARAQVQGEARPTNGSALVGAFQEQAQTGIGLNRRDANSPTPSAYAPPSSENTILGYHPSPAPHSASHGMSPPHVPAASVSSTPHATFSPGPQHVSASASPTVPGALYRPSFKRLASQTLAPEHAKRALLGPAGRDEGGGAGDEGEGGAASDGEGSDGEAGGRDRWGRGVGVGVGS